MPMKEFKLRWQVAGPPPLRLTQKQMDEHRLMAKFRNEGISQVHLYKEWKKNLNEWGIIERAHLHDEVFELFHRQLATLLREEGHAIARHRAYVQVWHNLLSTEKVIDISGIQYHLTRKINYAYNLHKETQMDLANFETKYNRKYELGSDRVDDLPPVLGEKTFRQKTKRCKSSCMLGSNQPLTKVDHIVLRQESKKYLNALKLRVQEGFAKKFKDIQKKRAVNDYHWK